MKRVWLAVAAYCALTIALTYPLILQLGSVLPNDAGDPALNTWILWWNAHAVPYTANWWNAPAFYPIPGVLAFSENLLGLSLVSTPLQWLGASPLAAYNIVFLLTFPLSAIGAYLLALEVTKRHDAAFIAGLLFGFSPYRIAHLPQIQSLAAFAAPFSLLGLHRYLHDTRLRWLLLFGAGWFLQGICNGYYLLFFSVMAGMWMLWFASPWSHPRTFGAILAAWVVAAVPLLPLLWQYRQIHDSLGFVRDFDIIRSFGADVAGLLYATSTLAFWTSLHVYKRAEGELFPGLTITLLIMAGAIFLNEKRGRVPFSKDAVEKGTRPLFSGALFLLRRGLVLLAIVTGLISVSAMLMGPWELSPFGWQLLSVRNPRWPLTLSLALASGLALTGPRLRTAYATRSPLGFYALAGFVMWLFSLGPVPTLMGNTLMDQGPYSLLMQFPGFNALRVPARFWMMTTLCLAVVGAILFDRLGARFGRARIVAAAIISLGVIADGWVSEMPLADPPPLWKAEMCGAGAGSRRALVEVPLGHPYSDVAAMYRSMSHGRPVVNGYSGYFPPHYTALRFGLALRDHDVLTQLAALGAADIVVDREEDPGGGWDDYVAAHPGVERICTEGKQTLYHLRAATTSAVSPGTPLRVAVVRPNVNGNAAGMMLDGDRATRWESGPQTERTMVEIDLGAAQTVTGVDLWLGRFIEDFPRGMVIELSDDGQAWLEVWRGGSAGLTFAASFRAPGDVPLTYRFPATSARYLRLRLTARDDTFYWSVAELKVVGP